MKAIGKKIVIVINGKGKSGKDTICRIMSQKYFAEAISEIDPIKDMARIAGWNGEKDDKSRKMLSDLKMLFVKYNDLPYNYAIKSIEAFSNTKQEILFIHIRESDEIAKVVKGSPIPVYTLLVERTDDSFVQREYGNYSDDNVFDFDYDFHYIGKNQTVKDLEESFLKYFSDVMLPVILGHKK